MYLYAREQYIQYGARSLSFQELIETPKWSVFGGLDPVGLNESCHPSRGLCLEAPAHAILRLAIVLRTVKGSSSGQFTQ